MALATCIFALFLCIGLSLSSPAGFLPESINPTEPYDFHEQLDANNEFHVYWKSDHTNITFELHVRTLGLVAFGLSTNGKMFPADIITGWVKEGKVFFQDRHSVGLSQPLIDESQDWTLLYGEENSYGTILKMTRKLDTCDEDDYKITEDTVRLLYAFHPEDPADENSIPFHGAKNRGIKTRLLLTLLKSPALPIDAHTIEWMNGKYLVPNKDTTYRCKIFTFDKLEKKHHVVKVEAIIQKGHENLIHHIIVYKCVGVESKFIGTDYECYMQPNKQLYPCGAVVFGWEFSGDLDMPETVGLPVGEVDDKGVYIMETHYNNPELITDIVDNSGIRITYTSTLRPYDAGVLMTGTPISPLQVVPPYEEHFITTGFCAKDCLIQELHNKTPTQHDPVIFAVWQHSHTLCTRIRTRQIRNGVELEPLADDHNYDWNYQGFKYLRQRRTLQAGDELLVECIYNTMNRRTAVFGGPSTRDEMCFGLVFYYPRMTLDSCQSTPLYNGYNTSEDFIKELKPSYNWSSEESRLKFKQSLINSTYTAHCHGERLVPKWVYSEKRIPEPTVPYVPPPSTCDQPEYQRFARK